MSAAAQQAPELLPPPGGWPLRRVSALRTVPQPPGGLIPYRVGEQWGFADTTGHVWIRPVFRREPRDNAFTKGLLAFAERDLTGQGPSKRRNYAAENLYVCNARGELLRNPWRHPRAFVLQPDSSLVTSPRVKSFGKPALQFRVNDDSRFALGCDWIVLPVVYDLPPRLLRRGEYWSKIEDLGNGYFVAAKRQWWRPARRVEYSFRTQPGIAFIYGYTQQAIFDAAGHRTRFRYAEVYNLVDGTVIVGTGARRASRDWKRRSDDGKPVRKREEATHFGLITPAGRKLLPIRYASLRRLGHDRFEATEEKRGRTWYSRLTSRGVVVRARQAEPFAAGDTVGYGRLYTAKAPSAALSRPAVSAALADSTDYVLIYELTPKPYLPQAPRTRLTLLAPNGQVLYDSDSASPATLGVRLTPRDCYKPQTIRRALTAAEAAGHGAIIGETVGKLTADRYGINRRIRLLDRYGRVVGKPSYESVRALASGWFLANVSPAYRNGLPNSPPDLLSPEGRVVPCPADAYWEPLQDDRALHDARFEYLFERPFLRGVMRTSKGYVTRGGRALWQD